jgi:hypothetical protein
MQIQKALAQLESMVLKDCQSFPRSEVLSLPAAASLFNPAALLFLSLIRAKKVFPLSLEIIK